MHTIPVLPAKTKNAARGSRAWRWLRNLSLALVVLVLGLLASGFIYQSIGAANDARNFPPPGQRVAVNGTQMHIYCSGEGSPTVILEALSGGNSLEWGWIQPEVAQTTRVCAYDRAGRMWSDPAPAAPDAEQNARNLHSLLQDANVAPPHVLIGHSLGGIYSRTYAAMYPREVVGIVLLDSAHPQQYARHPEWSNDSRSYQQQAAWFPLFARVGLFRLYFDMGEQLDFGDLPARERAAMKALWSSPEYHTSVLQELMVSAEIYAHAARTLGNVGDMPLLVVSATRNSSTGWMELQKELATLSTNSGHRSIDGATHQSLAFNPRHAHATAQAIQDVVNAARAGTRVK